MKIMLKVNLLMGIRRFSDNFPKIYPKTRVSEFYERASQASSTQIEQTKYSQHERSKRSLRKSSKPSMV